MYLLILYWALLYKMVVRKKMLFIFISFSYFELGVKISIILHMTVANYYMI